AGYLSRILRAVNQPALREAAQDAAQIAGVEPQLTAELGRGGRVAVRQLVEHPHLGERERALEVPFVQQADLLRVAAVAAPHGRDALREAGLGHRHPPRSPGRRLWMTMSSI